MLGNDSFVFFQSIKNEQNSSLESIRFHHHHHLETVLFQQVIGQHLPWLFFLFSAVAMKSDLCVASNIRVCLCISISTGDSQDTYLMIDK